MANEFYVKPVDISQGLTGLGNALQQRRKEKQAQDRMKEIKGAMQEAFDSGDPKNMAKVALTYPESAQALNAAFGFLKDSQGNEPTKRIVMDTYRRTLADPENASDYLAEGINQVSDMGGEPTTMLTDLGMLRQNPDAALKSIAMWYAGADPEGYQSAFGGESQTSLIQNMRAAGIDPQSKKGREIIEENLRGAGKTNINIGTSEDGGYGASQGVFAKELAKRQAEQFGKQTELADSADENIALAEEMTSILDRGLETGALTPARTGIDKLSQSALGFSLTGLDTSDAERFEAGSNRLAKMLRTPGEGVMTDKDFEVYKKSTANLGTSPEGNRRALTAFKTVQQRNKEKAREMEGWVSKTGSLDGFKAYWDKYMEKNPLFSGEFDPAGEQKKTRSDGWVLMTDADGNKAYVSPDRTQFEVVE